MKLLLQSDEMCQDEIVLFRAAIAWMAAHPGMSLLSWIRFPLLTDYQLLHEVRAAGVVSDSDILNVLQRQQPVQPRFLTDMKIKRRVFSYEHDLDGKGVIRYLAKKDTVVESSNTADLINWDKIGITASSVHCLNHSVNELLLHSALPAFWTRSVQDSWIQIEFKVAKCMPTAYTLQHGFNKARDGIRNWVLEGSDDKQSYELLRIHEQDASIGHSAFDTKTWTIRNAQRKAFQYLRIRQIGPCDSAIDKFRFQFCVGAIEFYGELVGDS